MFIFMRVITVKDFKAFILSKEPLIFIKVLTNLSRNNFRSIDKL